MSDIIVYNNGELEINVSVEDESIWLTQKQLAGLFDVTKQNISLHINTIFKDEELSKDSTVKFFLIVQEEGKRKVKRNLEHYNLDMIISVGYRVNSLTATKFRQWATSVLKNYIQDGYIVNTEKVTQQRLLSLENDISDIKSHIQDNSLQLKQGIFYNGQIFDAYVFVSDLIKSTKNRIVLIDNYIDESVLTLFSKNRNIKVEIYTQTITKQLKLDIEKYNKQYHNLVVNKTKSFHDRFMIIDNQEVYHIGASLKDLGKKIFAFSKIDISIENIIKGLK